MQIPDGWQDIADRFFQDQHAFSESCFRGNADRAVLLLKRIQDTVREAVAAFEIEKCSSRFRVLTVLKEDLHGALAGKESCNEVWDKRIQALRNEIEVLVAQEALRGNEK